MNKYLIKLILLLPFFSIGQEAVNRIELPVRNDKAYFNVINLGETGALMLFGEGNSTIGVTFYGKDLEQKWSNQLNVDPKSQFIESYQNEGIVYLLFGNERSVFFELIRISCNIGLIQTAKFNSIPDFDISLFKVRDEVLFMGGMIKKEPVVLTIPIGERTPKIITGGFRERSTIQAIEFTKIGTVLVSYILTKKRTSSIVLKEFNLDGKFLKQDVIEPTNNYSFINSQVFELEDNSNLIIGNFGFGLNSQGIAISQGIYIVSGLNSPDKIKTTFYSFTDFKTFFSFMSDKQQDRLEKKVSKKKSKGNDLKLDYKLLIHDLKKNENGFLLVADVFKPIIRSQNVNAFGMPFGGMGGLGGFGNPFLFSPRYFNRYSLYNAWAWYPWTNNQGTYIDGFTYTHAFMVYFNKEGEIQWDNSILYNNLASADLSKKISITERSDNFYAVYTEQNNLNFSLLDKNGNFVDRDTKIVKKENESIRETSFSASSHWFDKYYIYWGYQKLKNDDTGRRNVFFISKVAF